MGARNRVEIGLSYRPARLHMLGNLFVKPVKKIVTNIKFLDIFGKLKNANTDLSENPDHRVHTEWQWPLSGVHSITSLSP